MTTTHPDMDPTRVSPRTTSPFTSDFSKWAPPDDDLPREEALQQHHMIYLMWDHMRSFFESEGLYIYNYVPGSGRPAHPPQFPAPSSSDEDERWPWPRRLCKGERDLDFYWVDSVKVWPARDAEGHEVIIRCASGPEDTDELKVFKRLNTPDTRADPRNHTLPVLKYLEYEGLVFVVMPRWGDAAAFGPWTLSRTVSELLDLGEVFLEGLSFLHENRIVHRDIREENAVMNALTHFTGEAFQGLRTRGIVRYALIDFGESLALPMDTDVDSVTMPRHMRLPLKSIKLRPGPCNPFKDDVLCMVAMIQSQVRVLEDLVPELGSFFDDILEGEYDRCPSSAAALERFRTIRSNLSDELLERELPSRGRFWKPGVGVKCMNS